MYFEKSRITATLQHWPASEVPPPRHRMGAPIFPGDRDRGDNIVHIAGQHHSDRHLPVVRPVGGIESAAAVVETDFAANLAAERIPERSPIDHGRLGGVGASGKLVRR